LDMRGRGCRVRIQPPIIPGNHSSEYLGFFSFIKMTEGQVDAIYLANFLSLNAMDSAFNSKGVADINLMTQQRSSFLSRSPLQR
jgi:hypothetical protein